MTFPAVPLTNQWTDGEDTNAVILNARIDQRLNAAVAGVSFRRTRTATLGAITSGSNTLITSWPVLAYSSGSFGTVSGGILTFTAAGLFRWEMPVTWPNSAAYKARALLLINGAVSPDADNISDMLLSSTGGGVVNKEHCGTYQAAVGDTWQMAVTASASLTSGTVTAQSWTVTKVG